MPDDQTYVVLSSDPRVASWEYEARRRGVVLHEALRKYTDPVLQYQIEEALYLPTLYTESYDLLCRRRTQAFFDKLKSGYLFTYYNKFYPSGPVYKRINKEALKILSISNETFERDQRERVFLMPGNHWEVRVGETLLPDMEDIPYIKLIDDDPALMDQLNSQPLSAAEQTSPEEIRTYPDIPARTINPGKYKFDILGMRAESKKYLIRQKGLVPRGTKANCIKLCHMFLKKNGQEAHEETVKNYVNLFFEEVVAEVRTELGHMG